MERRHLCTSPSDRSDQIRAWTVCLQMENAQVKAAKYSFVCRGSETEHRRLARLFISVTVVISCVVNGLLFDILLMMLLNVTQLAPVSEVRP